MTTEVSRRAAISRGWIDRGDDERVHRRVLRHAQPPRLATSVISGCDCRASLRLCEARSRSPPARAPAGTRCTSAARRIERAEPPHLPPFEQTNGVLRACHRGRELEQRARRGQSVSYTPVGHTGPHFVPHDLAPQRGQPARRLAARHPTTNTWTVFIDLNLALPCSQALPRSVSEAPDPYVPPLPGGLLAAGTSPAASTRRGERGATTRREQLLRPAAKVTASGLIVLGIDALVRPSVTYGPNRPASSFSVVPSCVSSRSVFFCVACRRRDCFGARINARRRVERDAEHVVVRLERPELVAVLHVPDRSGRSSS